MLQVAATSTLACLAADDGLQFRSTSDSRGPDSEPLARLAARLQTLEANGFLERDGETLVLRYADVPNLDEEDRSLIDSLGAAAPLSLRLTDRGFLGSEDFHIEVEFLLGAKQVFPRMVGPFVELEDRVYQLPWAAFELVQRASGLNATEPAERRDLDSILRRWGETRRQAKEFGADLSPYLEQEEVIVADRVAPRLAETEGGYTSLVPEIPGVLHQDLLQAEYLKHGDAPTRYTISDSRGHRVRVVLEPEVHRVLEAWTRFRRLSPRERDRLLSDPRQLFPEDVSPDVVDLSRYGPRVRAIGQYPASVRAYVSSGQRWDELGAEGQLESEPERIGLELGYLDGDSEHCDFDGLNDARKLLDTARAAVQKAEPVVEFRGRKLRADGDLVDALTRLVHVAEGEANDDERVGKGELKRGPRGIGLLIYTNEEELEFALPHDEQEALDTESFMPPESLLPSAELKTHQHQGVAWLAHSFGSRRPGVLLADDMGLGKTLQALTFLAWLIEHPLSNTLGAAVPPYDPILIVAPPTLLNVWRDEIDRFFDPSVFLPYVVLTTEEARRMRVASGRESELGRPVFASERIRDCRLVITSYQTLSAYGLSLGQIDWSVIVADEAQALKDPNTRTSMVFKALKAGFRLALTGTPVETRLLDVWNLFDFLHPGLLGSAKEFCGRYEPKDAERRIMPVTESARELAARIGVAGSSSIARGTRLLRRTKEEELPDLPRKHVLPPVMSPLSDAQRSAYVSLVQGFRSPGRRAGGLELLVQINRLCQHPRLLGGDVLFATPEELVQECPKLGSLIAQLDEIAKKKEKALIFAHFRDAQDVLKRVVDHHYGIDSPILNGDRAGGTKRVHEARMEIIRRFQSRPGFFTMIVSPRVGGVGLTITAANHVFHYGRWWNPAREDQCTDRVYRIGQERDVYVYRMVANDPAGKFLTFDERLDELLDQRRTAAESFLTPQADETQMAQDLAAAVGSDSEAGSSEADPERPIRSLRDIAALSPEGFEALCAALVEAEGYETYLTPPASDGGIDVVGVKSGEILLVQCKHTASRHILDAAVVRELDDGQLYYRERVLPRALCRERTFRARLMTNAPHTRSLASACRREDVSLVSESELARSVQHALVVPSAIGKWLGTREESLQGLTGSLERLVARSV